MGFHVTWLASADQDLASVCEALEFTLTDEVSDEMEPPGLWATERDGVWILCGFGKDHFMLIDGELAKELSARGGEVSIWMCSDRESLAQAAVFRDGAIVWGLEARGDRRGKVGSPPPEVLQHMGPKGTEPEPFLASEAMCGLRPDRVDNGWTYRRVRCALDRSRWAHADAEDEHSEVFIGVMPWNPDEFLLKLNAVKGWTATGLSIGEVEDDEMVRKPVLSHVRTDDEPYLSSQMLVRSSADVVRVVLTVARGDEERVVTLDVTRES